MLDVTYKAVDDLPGGKLVDIHEDRGRLCIRLAADQPFAAVIRELNLQVERLLNSGTWYQWWDGEIISCATPDRPLRIRYVFRDWVTDAVVIGEDRGLVTIYIDPSLDVERFAAAVTEAIRGALDGGQWFQLYAGEIIGHSPDSMSQV
ncbi:hypothetical protein ACIQW4_00970 [Streptomyces albogriseolus]|uniref:hypothetical protein n=1 Tax=Streptomyces albogriseolus TaxID=1887 RepID=UPI00380924C0